MFRGDLEDELEMIVRGDGDVDLNITSFFDRIMASIEANGVRFTETCYDLDSNFVKKVQAYMDEEFSL